MDNKSANIKLYSNQLDQIGNTGPYINSRLNFFKDFNYFYSFPISDSYPIFYLAVVFTIIRYAFNKFISDVSTIQHFKIVIIRLRLLRQILFLIEALNLVVKCR